MNITFVGRRRNEEENDREPLVALVPCDAIILRGDLFCARLIFILSFIRVYSFSPNGLFLHCENKERKKKKLL